MSKYSVIHGLALGLIIPSVGFFLVKGLFDILIHFGLMESVTSSITDRRTRTITLIAICLNIIPIQLFNKRKYSNVIRGVTSATMLWAAAWLFMFYKTLF